MSAVQDPETHSHPTLYLCRPDARLDKIHMDIVGPLPPSQEYRYLLTVIDQFTRWAEAIPITNITASTVPVPSGWILRFGVPSTVTTDQGRQFESTLWRHLMQLLGSTRIRTTAYHPAANGLIERFHRQLKASLKACPDPTHWVDSLPLVLLGVRTAVKEDLSCSAAELVYGMTLRLPGEFFSPVQDDINVDPADFVARLKVSMQQLKASPVREQQSRKVYISKDMSSSTRFCPP